MKTKTTLTCLAALVVGIQHVIGFYNPSDGRWLSRDPIEEKGGVNLYAGMINNVENVIDPLGTCTIELWCWPAFGGAVGDNNVHCEYNISGSSGGNGRCRGERVPCQGIWRNCWCDTSCLGTTWQPNPPAMPAGAFLATSVNAPESTCDCLRGNCQDYPPTSCYVLATMGAGGHGTSNTAASCLNDRCSIGIPNPPVPEPKKAPGWGHKKGCPKTWQATD